MASSSNTLIRLLQELKDEVSFILKQLKSNQTCPGNTIRLVDAALDNVRQARSAVNEDKNAPNPLRHLAELTTNTDSLNNTESDGSETEQSPDLLKQDGGLTDYDSDKKQDGDLADYDSDNTEDPDADQEDECDNLDMFTFDEDKQMSSTTSKHSRENGKVEAADNIDDEEPHIKDEPADELLDEDDLDQNAGGFDDDFDDDDFNDDDLQVCKTSGVKRKMGLVCQNGVKSRRRLYRVDAMIEAFHATLMGVSVYRASRQYGVPESTLRDRTKGNVSVEATPGSLPIFNDEEERELVEHIHYMSSIGYPYTKVKIQCLATSYAVIHGKKSKDDRRMSDVWFYNFTKRRPDLKVRKSGKSSTTNAMYSSRDVVNNYYKELYSILIKNNLEDKPENIYSIDETVVSVELPKMSSDSNRKTEGSKLSTVTIIGGGNAAGNNIPPFYVFPGKRWSDDFLDGAPAESVGVMSESRWSNRDSFYTYMSKHFVKYVKITSDKSSNKTLVMFDGHKTHIFLTLAKWAKKKNIILFVLPPHVRDIEPPLEFDMFQPFKDDYHKQQKSFLLKNPDLKITRYKVASLTAKPYHKTMSRGNLTSAFLKAGIYPFNHNLITESQLASVIKYPSVQDEDEENPEPELTVGQNVNNNQTVVINCSSQTSNDVQQILKVFDSATMNDTKTKCVPSFLADKSNKCKADILKTKPSSSVVIKRSQRILEKKRKRNLLSSPSSATVHDDSSDSVSDSEEARCCVCDKLSPPSLHDCTDLVIVNWAECDRCGHWTHLAFCSEVKFVRKDSTFLCPHCL